ncbi:MAG: hypothetical protein KBB66_07680 [Prolixibacteraceae bacterium]|nr:hypothetical protein [Prolixibacteraceae bacterium]
MIYQFRCSCQESPHFQLEIDADSQHSFFDLHLALQSCLGFQPLELASFFISLARGREQIEVTQSGGLKTARVFPIRNTLLGDLMKPGIRFFRYVFDLMNDRYLQIQLTGTIMEKNLREPLVRMNRGKAPVQIMDEELQEEVFDKLNKKKPNADYGILTDYYEIFGEMEEYVL